MARTPEGALLRAVTDLLTAERVWWMRCNTGTHVLEHAGRKRVFRAGRRGMADLLALPVLRLCAVCEQPFGTAAGSRWSDCCSATSHYCIRPLWLELKSARGRQSEVQREFQQEVEEEGHAYLLARDALDVAAWLRGWEQ